MDGLRFAVLGRVRAWRDGVELELGTPQQRAVLTVLLLRRGRQATAEDLIDALWGDEPPARAMGAVRTYVSRLLGVLEPGHVARQKSTVMPSEAGAYALPLPRESLDLTLFEERLAAAEEARRAGDPATAARSLREALDLWGGEPLAGIHGAWAEGQRVHLQEQRLTALETLYGIELETGRAAESVAGLSELTVEHPLRERLRGLLMLALYRCGRQAEALGVYADTRHVLVEELGIDPGPELTDLHARILAGDTSLAETHEPVRESAPPPPAPAQLPADVADFTGRTTTVAELVAALTAPDRTAMVVVSVAGIGGVGKTTLAVHLGHAVREHYPDGQLFAELRGAGPDPAGPEAVIGAFLRALGVPDKDLPAPLEERSALLRTRLSDRRMLVVLDDARDADQVRPLLPGSAGCAVLVTSRSRLVGMHATRALDLDGLVTDEAITLFGRIAGEERVEDEREIAAQVVAACGHLPLAVRIVGSRLASRRSWSMATIAERLTDEKRRLDEMRVGNHTVSATFELGYGQLFDEQARAFRLLALPDVHDVSLNAAAAVLGMPEHETEDLLESLVDASLLETPAPGRYRYHDLLKLFARRQAERHDSEAARDAVPHRILDFYFASARNAYQAAESAAGDHLSTPEARGTEFASAEEALAWLEHETANLCAVVAEATRGGAPDLPIAADLLLSLEPLIMSGTHLWEFEQTARLVVTAALEKDHPYSRGRAGYLLGLILHAGFRLDEAEASLRTTVEVAEVSGDRHVRAEALNGLGVVAFEHRQYDDAFTSFQQAADVFADLGSPEGQANCLTNLARAAAELHRDKEALDAAERSLELFRGQGSAMGAAKAMQYLGSILDGMGRPEEAIPYYLDCLAVFRSTGQRLREHHTLYRLAESHLRAGRPAEAVAHAEEALAIAREIDQRFGEGRALGVLGRALTEDGRPDDGRACWEQALGVFQALGAPAAADVRDLLDRAPAPR
ncbi:AfsR/SARP family transcriptional regulator [Actinomadura sp. DC4]|uniref:AfsR/SARP family transcriptional regulator n=1 Tax=Actinomadura sp. DC4 TaxID=3055069 RepID=UPI0025AFF14D|nr:AfsR/SARP family transcriptional regulator [Actinomadura sp. DC4]MDN3354641.1 BTAD domain-containing putative transcriptional regulator [Actinomadura sp. DC4]